MTKNDYTIDVPVYEGPLDLLLHLIERSELDITALSLATVTNQFLKQVELLKEQRVTEMIDFIVIGARLMVIKSRALLPTPPVVLDGDEETEDPAEALVRQLKQYQQFKWAARYFSERQETGLHTYLRLAPPPKVEAKLDTSNVGVLTLRQMMVAVLLRAADRQDSVAVAAPRKITVDAQMSKLRHKVRGGRNAMFAELLSPDAGRTELSVTLLAVLEMIKRREVVANQPTAFGQITIEKHVEPKKQLSQTADANLVPA